ncbi:hypothetical protein ACGFMK_25755 [Amycolatopsis sp. NPDC049252]|uniref:hypothetical protein n=1 Tax=Amycolatopsis sp. NPDC049252 TaxID=3363933 RepID=UPI003717FBEE
MFDLVRDPRCPGVVNDIAVAFGNSRLQPLLDACIAGADVPDVSDVWRDTTLPANHPPGSLAWPEFFFDRERSSGVPQLRPQRNHPFV